MTLSMAAAVALSCAAQSKFDAYSLGAVNYYQDLKTNPASKLVKPIEMPFDIQEVARSGRAETSVIITLSNGASFDDIEASGLTIVQKIGEDMCVATGNIDDIIDLENVDAVKTMALSRELKLHLDQGRALSNVAPVHDGTATTSAYTGKGVLCGIFDSGIDPNHINFYDADFKNSRVKEVHNFAASGGTAISYTTPGDIATFQTDNKGETHGTHTLGCMAGGYRLKGNKGSAYPSGASAIFGSSSSSVQVLSSNAAPYYGTAPDADILVCAGTLSDANVIAAVGKIVDYAKKQNQPCVVNLSLGRNSGSHDGYDAVGQALERYSKDAIICVSSGNEGDLNISIVKTFTQNDKTLKTMIVNSTTATGILSIYGSDKNPFNYTIAVVNKNNGQILSQRSFNAEGSYTLATNNFTATDYQHDSQFEMAFSNSYVRSDISNNATTSGRRGIEVQYNLTKNSTTNAAGNYVLAIICEGNPGQRVDIVHSQVSGNGELTSNNLSGWSSPNSDLTINEMACNPNIIAVGSWTSRVQWPTYNRFTYMYTDPTFEFDKVSPFTSYGVLYNGTELPAINAPGAGIVSSINSYYSVEGSRYYDSSQDVARYTYKGRTYVWQLEQGTSMASPFCAGVIATWLEADPSLTVSKVKDILKQTASPLVGPAVKTGPGKLNAFEGLKAVLDQGSVGSIGVDNNILVSSNGRIFEVFVPEGNVSATVYNLNGQPVKTARTTDKTLNLDLGSLSKGIYLLNVNGIHTERIAIN